MRAQYRAAAWTAVGSSKQIQLEHLLNGSLTVACK
jgi:hypothetical protein